jgi:hypothetical protein
MITELTPGQFIVVGTNMRGEHYGGAAAQAHRDFGLKWGINEGLSGHTYAFPTLEPEMTKRGIRALERSRDKLYETTKALPEKEFLLTKVGCGIAGFTEGEIRPLFSNPPNNLVLPEDWR